MMSRVFLRSPFGPTDVNPDDIRDVACDATASAQICNPPAPDPAQPRDIPDLGGPSSGLGLFGQLLVVILVVALVLMIVWLVLRWRDGRVVDDDGDDGDDLDRDEEVDEEIGARVIDVETPPERWRRHAAEHRSAGRYRDAIRCQYRALVGDLARAGYVDEIPGRTSGEERSQVADIAPGLADAFATAADTFDVAWFDDGVVTSDDDRRFLAAETTVLDAALTGARSRGRS
jgi:hypothetical protein